MRCSTLTAILAAAAMAGAGCADAPEVPSAPPDIEGPNLAIVSAADLRTQIDALLTGPARLAAHFQLRRVQSDIQYRRPTLYLSALALAAIPLHEREQHRIPPEKLARLFKFLCSISNLIRPHLPPWLAAIDFCLINPGHLADDAKIQVVTNAFGGTVTTARETFSLDIEPNSMFNAAGSPVPFVLVIVLPLRRQEPQPEGDPHPCPEPWDDESFSQSEVDCYEEFYDVTVRPLVRFNPAADLEICQLDPSSENQNAPTFGTLARLELFTKDADNVVRILGNPRAVSDAQADCRDDNIEHAIGPAGWSRGGMRNALLRVARAGSHALSLFRPTLLYADNVPTHGDIFGELLFGNVVGAIDRGSSAFVDFVSVSATTSPTCGEGTHYCHSEDLTLMATAYNGEDPVLTGVTCTWTTDRGTITPTTTTASPHTVTLSNVGNPGSEFFDVVVEATCNDVSGSRTLPYQVDNW